MADPQWNQTPAVGIVLVKLVELYARALRLDAARRIQGATRVAELIKRRSGR